MRNTDNKVLGKPEWTRTLVRPTSRWEESIIRIDLREIGWESSE
jgi:hypothetical protein